MARLRYQEGHGGAAIITSANKYYGNRVYFESTTAIVSVRFYAGYEGAESFSVTPLLYSDNAGAVGSLIATGDELSVSGANELRTLTISASDLAAGYYWVLFVFDGLIATTASSYGVAPTSTLLTEASGWSPQTTVRIVTLHTEVSSDPIYAADAVIAGFTVNGTAASGLSKPTTPAPADASGPGIDFSNWTIGWADGGGAESFDVFMGTSPSTLNRVVVGTALTSHTFDVGQRPPVTGGVIYWRVDAIAGEDSVTGDVWSFDPRPGKATVPSPADDAEDQSLNVAALSWEAADYADTYTVYFTGYLAPVAVSQAGTTVPTPGIPLEWNEAYTWRVDSENEFGTTTGDTWSFGTLTWAPPMTTWSNLPGKTLGPLDGGVAGTDFYYTGMNFAAVVGRLVAAAADAIWYEAIDS